MVGVWDAVTGGEVAMLQGSTEEVLAVACSPDGARIATAGRDHTIRLWDATTFEEVGQLRGHGSYVWALSFTSDGAQLISSSGDYTVRV